VLEYTPNVNHKIVDNKKRKKGKRDGFSREYNFYILGADEIIPSDTVLSGCGVTMFISESACSIEANALARH
jgi:hypothetical protein